MGCCTSQPRSKYTTSPASKELNFKSVDVTGEGFNLRKRGKNPENVNIKQLTDEIQEASTAKVSKPEMTSATKRLINDALKRHVVFSSLTEENSEALMREMKLYRLNQKETIFEQGMTGVNYYIIAAGRVEVVINGRRVNVLKMGESFGELALLQNLPRSATVVTLEPCQLWVLDRVGFSEALKLVNSATYEENKEFIEGVQIFKILTKSQRDGLISSLTTQKFQNGELIVKQGDPGELFFIIKEGIVSCLKNDEEIRRLERGDYFGEQALLYSCTRTATCKAVGPVKCLSINRAELTKVLGISLQKIIYRNSLRIAFSKSEAFSRLTPEQHERIIDRMAITSYQKNTIVIQSGTKMGRKLWVVVQGSLATEGSSSIFAGLYMSVGDNEIMESEKRRFMVNIVAKENCDIAEITKAELERVIGGKLQSAVVANGMIEILKKCEILHGLSNENLQRISTLLTLRTFRDFEVIFEQGSHDTIFYIIKEGSVDIVKNGTKVRTITKLDYFGERSILSTEPRSATVIARGNVTCWTLTQQSFLSVVSQKVLTHLTTRIELQDEHVTLDQLAPVQVVGKGNFGIVTLVAHKQRRTIYALKSIVRWKIISYDIFDSVIQEKNILALLDHMFILKSVKTFKDQTRIYYLTEFVRGLDLFDVLRKIGLVSDIQAKFYISSLVLILEHLHDRDIVYRDLKPENILVDDQGYLKLVDFGTAKIISGRTYTILGTPHYMAPEVIIGKGYDCLADYWTLGIMLYEMVCGILPFGDDLRNPYDIYETILSHQIQYPRYLQKPFESQSMIEQLLSKHPSTRLGGSVDALKNHRWFRGFNWDKLTNKEVATPFVPPVPDYDSKITAAIVQKMSIHDFLANEERNDDKSGMKRRAEPANWDANF